MKVAPGRPARWQGQRRSSGGLKVDGRLSDDEDEKALGTRRAQVRRPVDHTEGRPSGTHAADDRPERPKRVREAVG